MTPDVICFSFFRSWRKSQVVWILNQNLALCLKNLRHDIANLSQSS